VALWAEPLADNKEVGAAVRYQQPLDDGISTLRCFSADSIYSGLDRLRNDSRWTTVTHEEDGNREQLYSGIGDKVNG